jgi:putative sigma-54 modulation protein
MNVEYTGRQYEVTPSIREQVEQGLAKLTKILGSALETHVILSVEKYRCIAEITVSIRGRALVGLAEASEMGPAIGEALDRIERQALKHKTRSRRKKRQPRAKWVAEAPAEELGMAVGASVATALPVVVHTFPPVVRAAEAHVVHSPESVAIRPMTVEEAIKEAEFRDRDVFVFRDTSGKVKVLHRTRNGKMELIEAP